MKSADDLEDVRFKFLLNEYTFLADYLKFNYEERDKYVNFYTVILTAVVAAVGFAIDKRNWDAVLLLASFTAVLSYFVLSKVLYQRVVVTEYKNYLNLTRGKLCELANCQSDIYPVLLPTRASVKYFKRSGGDAALHRILGTITAGSTAAAVYIFLDKLLASSPHRLTLCGLTSVLVFIAILFCVEHWWRRVLKAKDIETIEANKKRTAQQTEFSQQAEAKGDP